MAGIPEGATTLGRFHRAEGDAKRNRKWCLNYRKSDGWCAKRFMQCTGSAQCKYYDPDDEHAEAPIVEKDVKVTRMPVSSFEGVQMVDISLIMLSEKAFLSSNNSHVRYFQGIFKKTGKIEPPLTVSCKGSYYFLEDGNSRFFAAQNLGFTQVPVVIGTREENDFKKKLKVGTKVRYCSNEVGIITERTETAITIKYQFNEITVDIKRAVEYIKIC